MPSGIGYSCKDREVSFRRSLDERIRSPVPFLCVDVSDRLMRILTSSMDSTSLVYLSFPNANTKESSARLNWVDWMKAIGIGLIVYGHFFSLYDIYVYVFNVPLFFLISGFLCKKESANRIFWKKIWYNLVIPLLIICTMNYLWSGFKGYFLSSSHSLPENPLLFYGKLFIGIHGAVGTFWFVYTLIILKIVLQYTRTAYVHIVWFLLFLFLAYIFNNYDYEIMGKHPLKIAWSIPNTFVSYPFFIIGHFLRRWKDNLSCYQANIYTFYWIAISLFIVFFCGHNHKYVFLYICGYGDNLILYLLGGLSGSVFIFLISKLLEKFHWSIIADVSIGTTLILGFHMHIIHIIRHFFNIPSFADFVFSIIIVLLFVPIIRLCKRYAPIIMGKYRIKTG